MTLAEDLLRRLRSDVEQGLSFAQNVVSDNEQEMTTENIREALLTWDSEVTSTVNSIIDALIEEE